METLLLDPPVVGDDGNSPIFGLNFTQKMADPVEVSGSYDPETETWLYDPKAYGSPSRSWVVTAQPDRSLDIGSD